MSKSLFTIGYETTGQAELIAALQAAGVALVLDVRELPNSRRAGFSKRTLEAGLLEAGIGYRHFKALGTVKAGREANRAGRMDEFWSIVTAGLERPQAQLALLEAMELAREHTCCLLCLEEDPERCHRSAVAARMPGFNVRHLRLHP